MAVNKKIKWAVIGLGAQGETLVKAINSASNGCLAAVYSESKVRAAEIAKNAGVSQYENLNDLLRDRDIEAVAIATPNHQHARQSILALKAGKHVLCEKPMALSLKDALKIKAAVSATKRRFGVGFHLRFHPVFLAAKELIKSGGLGQVQLAQMHWSVGKIGVTKFSTLPQHMRWRENFKKSGGGALMARGVHLLDLAAFLLGGGANGIVSLKNPKLKKQVDQTTAGVARFGQTLVELATSRLVPLAVNHITIYGSRGRLFLPAPFTYDGTGSLEIAIGKKNLTKKFTKKINLYQAEIENFSRAILADKPWHGASIDEGVENVKATEKWI